MCGLRDHKDQAFEDIPAAYATLTSKVTALEATCEASAVRMISGLAAVEQTKIALTAAKDDALQRFNAAMASIKAAVEQHQAKCIAQLMSEYNARQKALDVQAETLAVSAGQLTAGAMACSHAVVQAENQAAAVGVGIGPVAILAQANKDCGAMVEVSKSPASPVATAVLDLVCNTGSVLACLDNMTRMSENEHLQVAGAGSHGLALIVPPMAGLSPRPHSPAHLQRVLALVQELVRAKVWYTVPWQVEFAYSNAPRRKTMFVCDGPTVGQIRVAAAALIDFEAKNVRVTNEDKSINYSCEDWDSRPYSDTGLAARVAWVTPLTAPVADTAGFDRKNISRAPNLVCLDSVDRSTLARFTRNDLGLAERLADEIRAGILAADGKDATQWLSIAGELVLVDDDVQPERVNLVMTAINAALKSQRHVYPATEMRLLVLCAIAKNCRAMRVWLHVLKAEMLWGLTWLRAQPPSYYYQNSTRSPPYLARVLDTAECMQALLGGGDISYEGFDENDDQACVVGARVAVKWVNLRQWYLGTIQSYDEATQKHKILFERGVRDINLPVHGDSNHAFKFVKPTTELRVPENPPYSEQEASWKVIVKGVAPRTPGEAPPVEEGKEGEPEGHGV